MAGKKVVKETKVKKPKKTKSKIKSEKTKQKKIKKTEESDGDAGIIVIEDDLKTDKALELEERRAYLEEARSQEASD